MASRRLLSLIVTLLALTSTSARAGFLYLPDVNAYIQASGQTVIGTASTYEAVLLFKATGGSGMILEEIQPFGEDKFFEVDPASGVYGYNNPVNGLDVLFGPVSNIALDVWHHAAYVYDGAEERLYFDGTLVGSRAASGDVNDADAPMYIGASVGHGYTTFVGLLDSVRVSDVARYVGTSFTPPTGDLANDVNTLLLYNFDDAAGSTTVTDSSANGRTGTFGSLNGGPVPVPCGADTGDMDGDLIPDSCDPDTPTTTTIITTTTSTSTTSMTGPTTTTTSTTQPAGGCGSEPVGATFISIDCRLVALIAQVAGEGELDALQPRLLDQLQRAKTHEEKAEMLCRQASKRRTRKALRPAINNVVQFLRTLRVRKARTIPQTIKDGLRAAADAIRLDMQALQRAVQCPEDAPPG